MSGAAFDKATLATLDQLTWKDNPHIPKAYAAVLVGDPTKADVVVIASNSQRTVNIHRTRNPTRRSPL